MGKLGKVALSVGVVLVGLAAIPIVVEWIHLSPTHRDAKLLAMSGEARALMPLGHQDWLGVPKNRWPHTTASLDPQWVQTYNWGIEVEISGFFDGGWGYHIVTDGGAPPWPIECYENLGHGVYWHDPC